MPVSRNAKNGKTIAIMQPYVFPYLGYFQLAQKVDEFWLLDSVDFIRQGWMNRNKILVNGEVFNFTLPVPKRPSRTEISRVKFVPEASRSLKKLQETMRQEYSQDANFSASLRLITKCKYEIERRLPDADFTIIAEALLQDVFQELGIETRIFRTSSLNIDANLVGQDRIIAICKAVEATTYLNMVGGQRLYDRYEFARAGLDLLFLEAQLEPYDQRSSDAFCPGLSILDVIARLSKEDLHKHARLGRFVSPE